MSSDRPTSVPRTAVPIGIDDPVEAARAELKAALSAIEEKINIPKKIAKLTRRVQGYVKREPVKAVAISVAVATAAGAAVWGIARLLSNPRS